MLKKEYNLTFIEDNCHSLTNHNNYKLGINGDLSFNSLRKIIPVLSGSEVINCNLEYSVNYKYKKRFPTMNEIAYLFRRYLSFLNILKKQKTINRKDSKINRNEYADFFSYNILTTNQFSLESIRKKRLNNFRFWQSYLKNKNVYFFDYDNIMLEEFLPYAFPCYVNDSDCARKWIQWGREHNISIIKWPKYPLDINLKLINPCFRHVLLFPVNHQFEISEILN